ncbi:MmcQ/YjbR family DNA-binding protein [bacterium]|nr:MmcQ/YjbR family DNA-binding protein [bacterium]
MSHPARRNRRPRLLEKVRAICLSWPETSEKVAWGAPTFRVRNRLFAMYLDDHHGDGRIALWIKAPTGVQELLVEAEPERFFRPPYVGPAGWVGVRLDCAFDWHEIADFLADGYRLAAPPKLAAQPVFGPRSVVASPAAAPATRQRRRRS